MAASFAGARYSGTVFAVAACLAPLLGLLAPLGEAPLFVLAGALLTIPYIRARRRPRVQPGLALLFAGLAALALLSCLWSIDQPLSLDRSVRLVGEIALGLVLIARARTLDPAWRARVGVALALGMGLTVLLILGDFLIGHAILKLVMAKAPTLNHLDRAVTTLAVLLWPALLLLIGAGRRWIALLLLVAVGVAAIVMKSDSSKLGLALAALGAAAVWWRPRAAGRALRIAVPLLVIAIPLAAISLPSPERLMERQGEIKNSALHRLIIWQFTGRHIAERPLLGWGMETSRALPGGDAHYDLIDEKGNLIQLASISLHPHNAVLQIWVELGLGGAVILGLLLIMTTRWIASLSREQGSLAAGGLLAVLAIALLSFGIWQSWWDAELWLVAALIAAACSADEGQADEDRP